MATVVIPVDPNLDEDALQAFVGEISREPGILPSIRHEDDKLVVRTERAEAAEALTAHYPSSSIRL